MTTYRLGILLRRPAVRKEPRAEGEWLVPSSLFGVSSNALLGRTALGPRPLVTSEAIP